MSSSWMNLSPAASMAVGVIVGLLSTCVQSFGLTLQRKSHMLEDEKEEREHRRPAYRRRRWQIGMSLFLLANIVGSTIQITTLPLPLLSTLQASGLVFNSLLASLLLKEPWTWWTVLGTVLVAGGAVLISFFSALPEPSHNLEQLLVLLRMRSFLTWFILSILLVGAMLVADFIMRKMLPLRQRENPRLDLVRGMSYGAISGILSAHALLLAKSAVELIVRSVADKHNEFRNYRSWLLLLAFLVLALSQLYYLHLGLRLLSTSILYPFVFCVYNIVAILDGLIYFRQMDRLSPLHSGLIALGTFVLLAGVLALSWRLQENAEDEAHAVLVKHEIPQTVLAPGMGFVGEPDSGDSLSGDAVADEDDDDELGEDNEGERQQLLGRRGRPRASSVRSKASSPYVSRRRRRATTWKEVINIWEELGDNTEHYGTIDAGGEESSGDQSHRRASIGRPPEPTTPDQEDGVQRTPPLLRARTMPASARSGRHGRQRTRTYQGSALFSDMLKMEWWRSRRRHSEAIAASRSPSHDPGHIEHD